MVNKLAHPIGSIAIVGSKEVWLVGHPRDAMLALSVNVEMHSLPNLPPSSINNTPKVWLFNFILIFFTFSLLSSKNIFNFT